MSPKVLRQIIPVALFFGGLTIVFFAGIGKFPKKLTPDFAEISASFQRRLSSQSLADKRVGGLRSGDSVPNGKTGKVSSLESEQKMPKSPQDPVTESNGAEESDILAENEKVEAATVEKVPEMKLSDQDRQAQGLAQKNGVCQSFELRGDGGTKNRVSRDEWRQTVVAFHHSKEVLFSWLKQQAEKLPKSAVTVMEKLLRDLKIVQPVYAATEEPDLSWRGIGVWTRDDRGAPLLLMGGGFLKLMKLDSKRAAFEMTRLVAQSWSPCELSHHGVNQVWSPLMKCLGEAERDSCAPEQSTESTWAVSSSIAARLSAPGCHLPVFVQEKTRVCLTQILGSGAVQHLAEGRPSDQLGTHGKKETN